MRQVPVEQGEEIVFGPDDDYLECLHKFLLMTDEDFTDSGKQLEEYFAQVTMWLDAWEEARDLKYHGVVSH